MITSPTRPKMKYVDAPSPARQAPRVSLLAWARKCSALSVKTCKTLVWPVESVVVMVVGFSLSSTGVGSLISLSPTGLLWPSRGPEPVWSVLGSFMVVCRV